jgi:hypothetical protein
MLKRSLVFFCVFVILGNDCVFAQQPSGSGESHKYRKLLTIVGGVGGAAIGLFAGLSAFDDSRNSERKVTTTVVLSGAGGAVGGYFLGRALDKRKRSQTITGWPTGQDAHLLRGAYPSVESLGIVRPTPQIGLSR